MFKGLKEKISGLLQTGSRLRNKIFLAVSLVAVIPIVASGILAFYIISLSHSSDVTSIEINLVSQKIEEVGNFITAYLDPLDIIFTIPTPTDNLITILGPEDKVDSRAMGYDESKSGERIEFWVRRDDLASVPEGILKAYPALKETSLIDAATGKELAYRSRFATSSDREGNYTDLSGLPQFQTVKEGKQYISPVYFTLNGPIVFIAGPVKNENKKVLAVLSAQLNLAELKKVFENVSLGNTGYIYLLDAEGNLLNHSGKVALEKENVNLKHVGIVPQLLNGQGTISRSVHGTYTSFWGEEVTAVGQILHESGLNWVVVAEWPLKDANQVTNTILKQFIFFSLAVLFLTVVLSIVLANRIVKPIKTLQQGTQKVAEGKFDEPVSIKTRDEIEELGAAFNVMMKGLKRLEELREEFVFIAAHELRTPVTAIQGYISFILDEALSGPLPAKAKEFFDQIIRANKRLTQLVEDLLQVARSEAGRLKIEVSPIDVVEPIKAVLAELKPLADEKKIQLVYESPSILPKVLADSDRLKEVMVNLVGNSIKYTLGTGTVTVSHELREKQLITHVKDTGVGMSKEAQKRLFEKFYRVQTEKTQKIGGTGLGLFIVKQIIEKMQGQIWVESEEGKGSTFSFSLPLA